MQNWKIVFTFIRPSASIQTWTTFGRNFSIGQMNKAKNIKPYVSESEVEKFKQEDSLYAPSSFSVLNVKSWNERKAVKKALKKSRIYRNIDSYGELIRVMQSLNAFPKTLEELLNWMMRQRERTQIREQQYLPERHAILKPDLAAAHFIVGRGGSIKFLGHTNWIGRKNITALPRVYIPGLFVEALNAEGTNLHFEGLQNITRLSNLKWLSLKCSESINDWAMDWLSMEYGPHLEHLDISECVNVTYRALSCFYRFKKLKTLVVEGISDSPEFKVACLMLQDIMPDLEILGVDLSIPEKLESPQEVQKITEGKGNATNM